MGGVQHRAKRRAGQLLTEMKQSGERQNQGDNRKTSNGAASKATLSDPWCYPRSILKVAAARGGCPGAVLVRAAYLRDWYRSGNSAHYRIAARLLNAQARALSNSEARRSRSFGGSGRTKFLGWRFESCNDLRHTARSVRWPKPRRKQPHSRHHVTPHFHLLDLIGPVHAVHAPSAAITRNGTASLRNSR